MTVAPAAPRPIAWRFATVLENRAETRRTRTLVLDVPGWPGHRAGQHVDVRLTAEDGYRTERSYSIASAPESAQLLLTIERLDDGEVSPYLVDELRTGDTLELRGPIGGYFVWSVSDGGPLLLVAGGSGVVPLMAMLRHRAATFVRASLAERQAVPVRLLYSSRTWDEIIYRDELASLAAADPTLQVHHTLTREVGGTWTGLRRRIDRSMLDDIAWSPRERPHMYVCGPTPMVEAVASTLVAAGHEAARVKTERFGPSG
jgi:Flavodoxin reductases (ferredoxin-NADPH reductases) family 1